MAGALGFDRLDGLGCALLVGDALFASALLGGQGGLALVELAVLLEPRQLLRVHALRRVGDVAGDGGEVIVQGLGDPLSGFSKVALVVRLAGLVRRAVLFLGCVLELLRRGQRLVGLAELALGLLIATTSQAQFGVGDIDGLAIDTKLFSQLLQLTRLEQVREFGPCLVIDRAFRGLGLLWLRRWLFGLWLGFRLRDRLRLDLGFRRVLRGRVVALLADNLVREGRPLLPAQGCARLARRQLPGLGFCLTRLGLLPLVRRWLRVVRRPLVVLLLRHSLLLLLVPGLRQVAGLLRAGAA